MWQRKQTFFLLLSAVAVISCLCLGLGSWEAKAMGADVNLSNFVFTDGSSEHNFTPLPLAVLLLLSLPVIGVTIVSFKNRKLQAKLCLVGIVDMILWYAYLAFVVWGYDGTATFHPNYVVVCLPLAAVLFFWLARRGVLADEALVRAADRIR